MVRRVAGTEVTDPRSTYRLQITASFPLHEAAELTDYLQQLGIDWVYVSPLLEASAGSDRESVTTSGSSPKLTT